MIKFMLRSITLTGILLLNSTNTHCNPTKLIKLSRNEVFIPERLGAVDLLHDDNGFKVIKDGEIRTIQNCFVEKEIRGISKDKLTRLLASGAYLSLNSIDEGSEYSLRLKGRLNGGGVGGATAGAWFGKAMVSVIGHGAIAIITCGVSLVATPAVGVATGIALESTLGASIEAASIAGAVACGVVGGVVTGPV